MKQMKLSAGAASLWTFALWGAGCAGLPNASVEPCPVPTVEAADRVAAVCSSPLPEDLEMCLWVAEVSRACGWEDYDR